MIGLIPGVQSYATEFLKLWISTNAFARELLDPYLSRVSYEEQLYFRNRYLGWLMGFSLPLTLLLSIPFVGLPCWGLAQAATPYLLVAILERNKEKGGRLLPGDSALSHSSDKKL